MEQFYEDYLALLEDLHKNFEEAISGLSTEALDWVAGKDMNSLCILVVHTMGATRYWVGDVAAQIPSHRVRSTEFEVGGLDAADLKRRLSETLAFVQSVVENLTSHDLETPRTSVNHPGESFTVGWAIGHALEHTGLHLGHAQITRQLWDQRHG